MKSMKPDFLLIGAILVMAICAPGSAVAQTVSMTKVPDEVASFVKTSNECDHWADEDPYDKARAEVIKENVEKLHCDALDEQEQQLRTRYAHNPNIIKSLDDARNPND